MPTTLRPTLALLPVLAGLAACSPENDIVDIDDTDVELDIRPPVDGNPGAYVPPEEPRFYLLEVPHGAAVSDQGHVLMFDPWTGGDVYVWTEDEGIEWKTTTGAFYNSVDDISADGSKIIGSYGNYDQGEDTQAAIWSESTGWVKLGALPNAGDCPMQTSGWSLSGDGSVAAGLAFGLGPGDVAGEDVGCSAYGFRWDATNGLVAYEQVGNEGNRVTRISDNGALAVGFAQGNFSRTPAAWFADGSGQVLNMNWTGEFYGVNADGTKAVGQFGSKAAVWEPGIGHHFLGTLGAPGETNSTAYDICGTGDGEIVIGNDSLAGGVATVWTPETELIQMTEWLEGLGLVLPPNTRLGSATDCSPDKRYIIGQGAVDDEIGVWVAILPEHLFESP